jgi:hypothetical protein
MLEGLFRPFAAKFVETTFEEYSIKHERSLTAPTSQATEGKKKIDIRTLYPHKHSDDELQARLDDFQRLKERVHQQREVIKKNDDRFERAQRRRIEEEADKVKEIAYARRTFELSLRKMANALPERRVRAFSHARSLRTTAPRMTSQAAQDTFFSLTAPLNLETQDSFRSHRPKRSQNIKMSDRTPGVVALKPLR